MLKFRTHRIETKKLKINKSKRFVILILFLFILLLAIDIPQININLKPIGINYQTTINHLTFNVNVLGIHYTNPLNPSLGLDLKGGSQLVLLADTSKIPSSQVSSAMQAARNIISQRVNLYGVANAQVYTETYGKQQRIVVDLAGVKNLAEAKKLVGETAKLEFLTLKKNANLSAVTTANIPISDFSKKTNLTGADLQSASITYQQGSTSPSIQLNFKPEGLNKFSNLAKSNVGKPIGIALDGKIIENPIINKNLANGTVSSPIITGNFSLNTAQTFVDQLNAGALPVPVKLIEENTVTATLGSASIKASIYAGILGVIIILLFMIWNYGYLGLVADFALLIYALLAFAIFKLIPITLTLEGIAGFILSIGMAVDANILIFERMREEKKDGRSRKSIINLGFKRAWNSIRDSNVSTLITTLVLYILGTSQIRGFAITLAIGVMVSLFTAVVVTRHLLQILYIDKQT
jgi:preprotein translocase subunit SecD